MIPGLYDDGGDCSMLVVVVCNHVQVVQVRGEPKASKVDRASDAGGLSDSLPLAH